MNALPPFIPVAVWYSPAAEDFDAAIADVIHLIEGVPATDTEDGIEGLADLAYEVQFGNAGRDNESKGCGPQSFARDLTRTQELVRELRAELEALR